MKKNDINIDLRNYIEDNIFPLYSLNDEGHRLDHIFYVLNRSFKFAKQVQEPINANMLYTIATYHDCGHHIDAKNHEKISAEILEMDKGLREFFTPDQILIMKEAVEDHRASSKIEPRSIYGKIVSSADRIISLDIAIQRTYTYRLVNRPNYSLEEIIAESKEYLTKKHGENGYGNKRMYFEDEDYQKVIKELTLLLQDDEAFVKKYKEVNHLS